MRTLSGIVGVGVLAVSGSALAGISATKHNLSATGTFSNHTSTANTEICAFCHTPHGGATGAELPPLWNKNVPTGATYQTYTSTTLDAAQLTVSTGPSVACLSCHDGAQALDNMINQPGSGGYNAGGASAGYTWPDTSTMTNGKLDAGIAFISSDLRNDHPISIAYCGGGITNTGDGAIDAGGTCADTDFNTPKVDVIGTTRVWWVDTGTAGRQKSDMILYSRDFSGTPGPSVECASCHDPHSSTTNTFLRINNTGSAVCLACHNK
jgi:predicted CXXCH cytochrome family protein